MPAGALFERFAQKAFEDASSALPNGIAKEATRVTPASLGTSHLNDRSRTIAEEMVRPRDHRQRGRPYRSGRSIQRNGIMG